MSTERHPDADARATVSAEETSPTSREEDAITLPSGARSMTVTPPSDSPSGVVGETTCDGSGDFLGPAANVAAGAIIVTSSAARRALTNAGFLARVMGFSIQSSLIEHRASLPNSTSRCAASGQIGR